MQEAITWHGGPTQAPLPPKAPGEFLLGNARQMGVFPIPWIMETARMLGPIFRASALTQHFTIMAGLEANQFLQQEGGTYLTNRVYFDLFNDEMNMRYNLISLDGDEHKAMRKQYRPPFARSAISGELEPMFNIAVEMARSVPLGMTFNVQGLLQRVVMRQLGLSLLHRDAPENFDALRLMLKRIIEVSFTRTKPRIALRDPRYIRAKREAMDLGREVVEAFDPDGENGVYVDAVMAMTDPNGEPLPEEERISAALFPFFAGMDTVANTASSMLYAMAKHPKVAQRVRQEVDASFGQGKIPGIREIGKMQALHGTAMETLRMYPVGGVTKRSVVQQFEFAGHRVDADTDVLIANGVTHFLPEFFPEPYTFDIDRYHAPRSEHRQVPGAFAPFTLGPHTCLGAGVAEVQLAIILAAFVYAIEFEVYPSDYELTWALNPAPGPDPNFRLKVTAHR